MWGFRGGLALLKNLSESIVPRLIPPLLRPIDLPLLLRRGFFKIKKAIPYHSPPIVGGARGGMVDGNLDQECLGLILDCF